MLVKLRLMGILLFPAGPPNTTHLLQVMDQLFGYFKTIFFQNFETLWNYRLGLPATHAKHEKITRNDIGMLVFGAELPDGELLHDAFAKAFTKGVGGVCFSCVRRTGCRSFGIMSAQRQHEPTVIYYIKIYS
jgi:hypothetical protein